MKKEARERSGAEGQAALMGALSLNFERKVGEHGILYGSVTSMDIAEALKQKGFEVDRRRISLREAIKETGEFSVSVRLHREVTVEIPVIVTGEGGTQTAGAAAASTADEGEAAPEESAAGTSGETDEASAAE
jgi:large subunit ribosomal protein L9